MDIPLESHNSVPPTPGTPESEFEELAESEFTEHDYEDDDWDSNVQPALSPYDRVLFCAHCNRIETHGWQLKRMRLYWLLWPIPTFLLQILGPYRCRCCGHRRLFGINI